MSHTQPGFEPRQSGSKACVSNLWASYTPTAQAVLETLHFEALLLKSASPFWKHKKRLMPSSKRFVISFFAFLYIKSYHELTWILMHCLPPWGSEMPNPAGDNPLKYKSPSRVLQQIPHGTRAQWNLGVDGTLGPTSSWWAEAFLNIAQSYT